MLTTYTVYLAILLVTFLGWLSDMAIIRSYWITWYILYIPKHEALCWPHLQLKSYSFRPTDHFIICFIGLLHRYLFLGVQCTEKIWMIFLALENSLAFFCFNKFYRPCLKAKKKVPLNNKNDWCSFSDPETQLSFKNYKMIPSRIEWDRIPTDPFQVSCDRAIRHSGFFGVREKWVRPLGISWNDCSFETKKPSWAVFIQNPGWLGWI